METSSKLPVLEMSLQQSTVKHSQKSLAPRSVSTLCDSNVEWCHAKKMIFRSAISIDHDNIFTFS